MFYCQRVQHATEEIARNEAKRLSETMLSDYDRLIEHEAYACPDQHFGKWHVRVKNSALAKDSRQVKLDSIVRRNRSHYKNDGREKVAYNSMREARAQARAVEAKEGVAMAAYQCAECHQWHVGRAQPSEVNLQSNGEQLEAQQKRIGYNVTSNAEMVSTPTPRTVPVPPVNRFAEAASKLQTISQRIARIEADVKCKTDESRRLMDMSLSLFDQAAEAEKQGKGLAVEAQTSSARIAEMKVEAQSVMKELNQAFAA
jgi:hypothetical protein